MRKEYFYLFLVSLCLLGVGFTNVYAEETATRGWCFGYEEVEKNGDTTITITNYKSYSYKYCPEDVVIPSEIDGKKVTAIGYKAFMSDWIASVVIPNTVTSIGALAFANNYLETIDIPNSVTKIGYAAFNNNPFVNHYEMFIYDPTDSTRLVSVAIESYDAYYFDLPSKTKTIGTKAFYGLNDIWVSIPEGVTTIENKAFHGALIYGLDIPSTVETADMSVDVEQMGDNIIYHTWYNVEDFDYPADREPYTFVPNTAVSITSDVYFQPEMYYNEGKSVAYNKVKLEYYGDGSIDGIEVWRYDSVDGEYKKYKTINTVNTESYFYISGLTTGKTYYFKIRSFVTTPDGVKHYSDFAYRTAVKPKPSTPTGVKATKYKSGVAKITWNKVSGATGYAIYKYNSKTKQYYYVKSVAGTSTTTSTGLKSGSSTYYRVKAYRTVNGERIYSNLSASTFVRV